MDEGMEAVNIALKQFELDHHGHRTEITTPASREFKWINYFCNDCGKAYRVYTTDAPPAKK